MTDSATSRAFADLELMRAAPLLESDPAAAVVHASRILAEFPDHAEARLLLASARRRLGDAPAALAALEPLSNSQSDSAFLQLEMGRTYAASGTTTQALAAYRRALTQDPNLADGWSELAACLFEKGETLEGDRAFAQFVRLRPDPPELNDAALAVVENRMDAAEAILRERLRQLPNDPVAMLRLAELAVQRENFVEAERHLIACLKIAPGYAAARYELARLLLELQRDAEVLPLTERLLAAEPGNLDYLSLQAHALRRIGRTDEAIGLMQGAVSQHAQEDRAWNLYGHLLREIGQQARAIEMYRRAIAVRPASGHAYSSLANLKTFRFDEADSAAMRAQLALRSVTGADRTHLEFALGQALEDSGDYAASFEHYARGNALKRATTFHDADVVSRDVLRLRALYSESFFAARRDWGTERCDPIFIVGLPRSGSTLLEQMLASHSQVEGTHELPEVPAIVFDLESDPKLAAHGRYPEVLAALGREDFDRFAERYLARTQIHRALGKPRFVDKMLANFGHLGLVHLMFPRAAIIETRRHPLGGGFSCYKQLFAGGHSFSYDLQELGRYIRDYVSLMEHIDAVLPGRVHRVYYERMIADPEQELRRLLDYCGLPYEAQCLRFHENPRVVQTISSEQVRRPLYTHAVDQWRRYEPWLGPLKAALGDVLERYPAIAIPSAR